MSEEKEPRLKPIVEGVQALSLGISMVVAVVIGVAIGIGLQKLTGSGWTIWIGIVIGIGAAFLNVFKAYNKQYKEFEKLAKDPRYNHKQYLKDDDDDDDRDPGDIR